MGIISTVLGNIRNMNKANKIRKMGKEKLLALGDEEFYEAICCLCDDAVYDIKAADLTKEQIFAYSLYMFEMEVNNGGLCQFFVNSSSECAPFIGEALEAIGATELKSSFERFTKDNGIDVTDLSSFKIADIEEYEVQTERFDFDEFDNGFYDNENLHRQIIDYFRANVEQLLKD